MYEQNQMLPVVLKAAKIVGSIRQLAKDLGVTRQALYGWKQVPVEQILPIEKATGGKVTRHQMRPDLKGLFPREKVTE